MEIPTVQRDLAELLGIRRDNLNKLLARTRRRLAAEGKTLPALPRRAPRALAALVSLDNIRH